MEFKLPDVGEGITEAEIVEWLVKEGDTIKEDQNIVKIETDKAVVELPSPASGIVLRINKKQGETVHVGETLVEIGSQEKKTKEEKPVVKEEVKVAREENGGQGVVGKLEVSDREIPPARQIIQKEVREIRATPAVRRLAQEKGIDISTITGTGKEGRIMPEDLDLHAEKQQKVEISRKYDLFGYVERIPVKGIRKAIRDNMEIQARIPAVTHMDDCDITRLAKIQEKEKKNLDDVKLTYLPFVIKAVVNALKAYPIVGSVLQGEEILVKKYYNIGIAVATEDGLIVPVLKGAEQKSIHAIAKELESLAEKGRARTLDLMDMKGSVFTITNVGSIGGLYASPIINPGESAILALGRAYDKPAVVKNNIRVIKALPLSLTFDHRIFDGAVAALFVNKIKEYLEDPDKILIEG